MIHPKQERLRIVVRTAYDVWMRPEKGKRAALIRLIRARADEGVNSIASVHSPDGSFLIRRAKK